MRGLIPDDWWDDDEPIDVPSVDVEIGGPEVLGVLLGVDGEVAFTLVDRPILPFGFCRGETA